MLLTSGCTDSDNPANSRVVQIGDNISVNYTGMLEDGTVFDTQKQILPKKMEFTILSGNTNLFLLLQVRVR